MTIYFRVFRLYTVFIEFNRSYTTRPVLGFDHFGREKIIHMPYTVIIITPDKNF